LPLELLLCFGSSLAGAGSSTFFDFDLDLAGNFDAAESITP